MFENPRRGRQTRNFTINVLKILDFKSSSEQIFSENCRRVPLSNVPLSFPNVDPSIFWSTEMTANPNQRWEGKITQVFQDL